MLLRDFQGADQFIRAIDEAVTGEDCCSKALTDRLRQALCRAIKEKAIALPPCVYEANPDHYARRELYNSEKHGYSVIAMTWGPHQGTLIHDHSGMWCVEGVWHGSLEITQYDLRRQQEDDKFQFEPVGSIQAGAGSAGSLIPPHEYHTIRNPADDDVAVSVHIYSGKMNCCSVFRPVGDDWYERDMRQLSCD